MVCTQEKTCRRGPNAPGHRLEATLMRRLAGPVIILLFVAVFLLWALFWAPELMLLAVHRRAPSAADQEVGW